MTSRSRLAKLTGAPEFLKRLGLDDFIFFPYVLAVVWPFLWNLSHKPLAWLAAIILSLGIWYGYVAIRPAEDSKRTRVFWIIVFVPLAIIYSSRVAFPDVSFDVLNYHVFHGERALRGPLLTGQDFFPTPAPFNPAPDILTGLYRHALGYRLGTIANLLAVFWLGIILDRFLSNYIRRSWLRAVAVLLILSTEQIFFQINNYMVDLLALPLLLQASVLALRRVAPALELKRILTIAFLLGISVTFKLANVAFAFPIVLLCLFGLISNRPGLSFRKITTIGIVSTAAFFAPLAPFSVLLFRLTGNPFFPLYNGIFKSPYWRATSVFDPRWGPRGLKETVLWPLLITFKPERICELPVYSGRLSIGFIAAAICIPLAKSERNVVGFCFITLIGSIIWSAASGYSRYMIFVELTGGLVVVWLAVHLSKAFARYQRPLRWWPQVGFGLMLVVQSAVALNYYNQYEWSMRPTLIAKPGPYADEIRHVLRDQSLVKFLPEGDRVFFNDVDVWIISSVKTTVFMGLLRPDVPAVNGVQGEYLATRTSRSRFNSISNAAADRRLYSLCFPEDLASAKAALESRGLAISSVTPVSVPFFSDRNQVTVNLLRVTRENPMYRAQISLAESLWRFAPGEKRTLRLRVKNTGQMVWRAFVGVDGRLQVNASDTWLAEDGETVVNDMDGRASLPHDIKPGEEVELNLAVTAPAVPGKYILELDMVHEGVAFFYERNSEPLRLNVEVKP